MSSAWRRRFGSRTLLTHGDGAISRLPGLLDARGWQRPLLVCGRRSFEASGAAEVLPALETRSSVTVFRDFAPNTDSADLERAVALAAAVEPDVIMGIGGGSAMDMAKLICALLPHGRENVLDRIRHGARIETRAADLVLAPTTSGSGSEATHFAVVYIGDDKFSVAGAALVPDAVILDPLLTLSSSAYQRATSGMDAVCQAIESLWAVTASSRSRRPARKALAMLMPAIQSFVDEPSPEPARAMCLGSHLAGRAIDISRTTAAHALSYAITKRHGISHGHAVALTLGPLIEAHANATPADLRKGVDGCDHDKAMKAILRRLGARDGAEGHALFVRLMKKLGLHATLNEVGVSTQELLGLAQAVNPDRLVNNPVTFDTAGLTALLRRAV